MALLTSLAACTTAVTGGAKEGPGRTGAEGLGGRREGGADDTDAAPPTPSPRLRKRAKEPGEGRS